MHDKLFANQNALDDASLLKYSADLWLDAERLGRELPNHVHSRRVADDRLGGLASGVSGTPDLFISMANVTTVP